MIIGQVYQLSVVIKYTIFCIGQSNIKSRLKLALTQIKEGGGGPYLKELISSSLCDGKTCSSWAHFDRSSDVELSGIKLHKLTFINIGDEKLITFMKLTDYFMDFLEGILQKVESYFPSDDTMDAMEALDQSLWPEDIIDLFTVKDLWSNLVKWRDVMNMHDYSDFRFTKDLTDLTICLSEQKDFW